MVRKGSGPGMDPGLYPVFLFGPSHHASVVSPGAYSRLRAGVVYVPGRGKALADCGSGRDAVHYWLRWRQLVF